MLTPSWPLRLTPETSKASSALRPGSEATKQLASSSCGDVAVVNDATSDPDEGPEGMLILLAPIDGPHTMRKNSSHSLTASSTERYPSCNAP
mmetsp:Transcript_66512/g.167649  ORF Transcript_66512/g.167649 Transcript_66512/m.167649 type:complete len:92 (+) Transcript_66512:124-399(+)